MPPPELATAPGEPAVIHGWGATSSAPVTLLRPHDPSELDPDMLRPQGAIARGLGRSYGDAAQLSRGWVIDTSRLKRFDLDAEGGTVTAQAGVTLGELLDAALPAGWTVPVLPGTQHVTVGGAIASDVHGKNHGAAGTFGRHVQALALLTAAGEVIELTPDSELFAATVGGMGLTGIVVWARIVLRRVGGALMSVDTDRATSLEHALELLREPGGSHRVAWLDLLGSRPGRGVVTRAEHLDAPEPQPHPGRVPLSHPGRPTTGHPGPVTVRARAVVPERWPGGILRAGTVSVYNELRYRRTPRRERGRIESIGAHLFPLDALDNWPRLYGRQGFVQYQFVVPIGREDALMAVVEHVRRSRIPCFLAVLKDLGAANPAPLSFPIAGWTLTMDLPGAAPGLRPGLDRCDELVAEASGRVYLTKDARMRPEAVRAMYPRLEEWRSVRDAADPDGVWRSDLGLRTGLVDT
jgi:decaprenylphospho-beta-D-ribofuranose 2-oxidase